MNTDPSIVLIVDDDPSVRASVMRLLRAVGHRVHAFASTDHLPRGVRPAAPCCLVLDVQMPHVNGLQFKESMDRAKVRVPVIFITGVGDIPMSVRAMKAGAFDFLAKPFDAEELIRAVDRALEADRLLLSLERRFDDIQLRFDRLTPREQEVLFAVTDGLLNKQAGVEMGITEKTIKVHRARVMEKMGAESLPALVRMADLLRSREREGIRLSCERLVPHHLRLVPRVESTADPADA